MGLIAALPDRGVVRVSGEAARTFLQDLLTTDIDKAVATGAGYGALLTPQGKILFDFLVFSEGEEFLFDLPKSMAADFAKRLAFYRLRAKVEISDVSASRFVVAAWGSETAPEMPGLIRRDPRLPGLGWRILSESTEPTAVGFEAADPAGYHAHRVANGVPEGGLDFQYGDAFPHDVDLDQLGGIAFDKGCYVGQEVVSRMEHRGTARRRIVTVSASGDLPATGAAITAGGRSLGTLGSVSNGHGLALVRLDRAKEAIDKGEPILAGDVPAALDIPAWAHFGWPAGSGEA